MRVKNLLDNLITADKSIIFVWVKAHSDIKWNEEVDALAKEARHDGLSLVRQIPVQDIISHCKKMMYLEWNVRYTDKYSNSPTNYFELYPKITKNRLYQCRSWSRKTYTIITRLKFKHCRNPTHLFKIGVLADNRCDFGAIGDLNHLFFECPHYENHREEFIQQLVKEKINFPTNINNILSTDNIRIYNNIANFVEKCSVLI